MVFVSSVAVRAATVERAELEPGVYACVRDGRTLYLEVSPPRESAAPALFARYLAEPATWTQYRGRISVAVPLEKLSGAARREMLLALFPEDHVDTLGWWHQVVHPEQSWANLASWFTGRAAPAAAISAAPENRAVTAPTPGARVLIPRDLLLEPLREPTRAPPPLVPSRQTGPPPAPAPELKTEAAPPANGRAPAEMPVEGEAESPLENGDAYPPLDLPDELVFATDAQGPHAVYTLKRGEALYTAVVVRFTDFRDHKDILEVCDTIQRRSGITDVRKMRVGQVIRIPVDLLSDRFAPVGSERRQAYDAMLAEAERLRGQRVASKELDGVVVIIDPGHGGRDYGAACHGLYEDELTYDIACRLKRILERDTRARVHMTLRDPSQGFTPSDARTDVHDTDEVLLTPPPYENQDARISANLRWYLANHIYRKERAAGVDERKMVFISIHCDMLFNTTLRGAMVYVPGAQYRRDSETPSGSIYDRFAETRGHRTFTSTAPERRRDEALSHNFAETLLEAMRKHNPPLKVHSASQPIRNVIRQSGGRAYLPAVLRNCAVPTKVLIEVANMNNATDRGHLANPEWREWLASAIANALKQHFAAG
jgi:N-acetylmuramoyl-L-alanine amidase